MANFFEIKEKEVRSKGVIQIYPSFKVISNSGLMIKGGKFYALWDEDNKIWSKNEFDLIRLVDEEIDKYVKNRGYEPLGDKIQRMYLSDFSSNTWKEYKKYTSLFPDNYKVLDQKVMFANDIPRKTDYCSHKLPYDRIEGPSPAYDELVHKFYAPEELEKIEWAIGSIFCGDSTKIQKFIVLRGEAGTGKSTMLNIIDTLFEGYTAAFKAKELVSGDNQFAGDAFANNPLVGINGDADLSNIKDNSILNTIIAHEKMVINEKYKTKYELKPGTFLFVGTNNKVKITDARSGLIRRIIDVTPTGDTFSESKYDKLVSKVNNELGQIADHCIKVYESLGKSYYSGYKPLSMMYNSDPVFNFVEEHYLEYKKDDCVSLTVAYNDYKRFCNDNGITNVLRQYEFRDELSAYFKNFHDRLRVEGSRKRSYFEGFKTSKFDSVIKATPNKSWLDLKEQKSILDELYADEPAQYEVEYEPKQKQPETKWINVETKLSDIDTSKVHYVKPKDIHHIFIDFDIKDKDGNKQLDLSLKAARDWPETYAETSQSGNGLHLHYIYDGDVSELASLFDKNIEIKKCNGGSAFRRKLVKCNNIPIAHLKVGDLPLKEKKKVYDEQGFKNEKQLRSFIEACLRKEHNNSGSTASEISFIKSKLDEMYESGIPYNVTNMKPYIVTFAANSTNQSENCLKMVSKMKFKSKDLEDPEDHDIPFDDDMPLVFFDIEVFPNLLLICWKLAGKGNTIVDMTNPTPDEIRYLFSHYRLVGYNNRRYDNHVIYGASLGLSNIDIYHLSKKLIKGNPVDDGYGPAWNISYTDIWDYLPAPKKQKLKKWEIDLGIHHQELGYDWDQPVPKELWPNVIKYCHYDVEATEATWNATQGDFLARQILAELTGKTVNTSTNKLTQKLIFGDDKNPVSEFRYRNLAEPVLEMDDEMKEFLTDLFPEMMAQRHGPAKSLLPYFPTYRTEWKTLVDSEGKKKKKLISSYRDVENVGEGGRVWAKPGMYGNVWVFDITSMHPHSIMAEYLFGLFTRVFRELVYARVYIKHGEIDRCRELFDGRLIPFLDDPVKLEALPDAFKTAINAVYGQTKATFECILKDPRNFDNIVAKRGALFMIDLHHALEDMGVEVISIKTDSIKVVDPSEEVKQFIVDFGKRYGYSFEVEHIFEKICLVNDAVFIAKMDKADESWIKACKKAKAKGEPEPTRWTATGTEFQVPYVFKTLFSHENIEFKDLCEVKSSKNNIYLDFNETLKDVSFYEHCKDTRDKIKRNVKTTKKAVSELDEISGMTDEELDAKIAEGHDYRFVGAIGLFCPVREGTAGAKMVTPNNVGKWSAPSGTKNYRWKEAEIVEANNLQDTIDVGYFEDLVSDAIKDISKFGDFESFAA